jgi:hypothetical protein
MIWYLGNQNRLSGTSEINRNDTSHILVSSDCGMSESLMLAVQNSSTPNSIVFLLGDKVFFEVRRRC